MANKTVGVNIAFNADTSKAKAQIQELQTLLNKITYSGATGAGQNKISKDLKDASAAAKELQYHLNNAYNANTGKLDLSLLDKSLKTTDSNLTELSTKLLSAGTTGQEAFVKMAQSISQAEQPMLKINSKVKDFANTLKNAAKYQIGNVVVQGLMGSLSSAVDYAKDLNTSLNEIRIVSGSSADEMARFAEEANKTAKKLSSTTLDYTNASLIYYQQGLSDAEVQARTETTLKMANVAGTSAQTVSDQMTAVWNNFYDGSKSLEYYSDVMVELGAATASSTDEISEGVNKFAATAKTVGLSYEYATAALATVTARTRESADTVGNAFKTLFSRIQGLKLGETLDDGTTLNKYSKALQSVGISIKDQGGQLKEMDQILDEMGDKWSTLGEAEKMALAQTVGGARQYTQLMALMENWDYFKENLDVAYNSEGALEEQAKIYEESWAAASKRVEASLQGVYKSLLDDKFFISLNNGFANALGGLEAFIEGAGGAKTIITGLASAMIGAFANKIPDALRTAKYNIDFIRKGSEEAYKGIQKQMQEATDNAFRNFAETHGKEGINPETSAALELQYTNDLLAAKNKLAAITDKMTAAEKQQYNVELSLIEAHQKETVELQKKCNELENTIEVQREELVLSGSEKFYGVDADELMDKQANIFGAKEKKYETQSDLYHHKGLESESDRTASISVQYEEASKIFSKVVDEVDNFTQKINAAYEEMNHVLVDQIANGEKIDYTDLFDSDLLSHLDMVKNKLIEISNLDIDEEDKLSAMKNSIQGISKAIPPAIQEATGLSEIFKKIGKEKSVEALLDDIDELKEAMKNAKAAGKDAGKILEAFHNSKEVREYVRNVKEGEKATEELGKKKTLVQQLMEEFKPTHIIQTSEAIASLAYLMGGVVTVGNSLTSMFKSWFNPDLSGWEKVTATISAASMVMTSSINVAKQFGIAIEFLNQKMIAHGIVLETSTAKQKIDAAASLLARETRKKLTQKIGEENVSRLLTIALAEKEKGATEEEIAVKLLESKLLDKLPNQKLKEAAAKLLAKAATDAETKSTWGLVASFLALKVSLLGIEAPLWVFIAALAALAAATYGIVKLVDWLVVTEKEANEAISEANTAYEEEKNKVDELKSSLESLQKQIEELENKDTLTLIEEEELQKLREEEASLKRQLALQEQLAKAKQHEAAKTFEDNFKTSSKWVNKGPFITQDVNKKDSAGSKRFMTASEYYDEYVKPLEEAFDKEPENNTIAEALKEEQQAYEELLANENKIRADYIENNQENYNNLVEGYKNWLEQNPDATSEEKATYAKTIQQANKNFYGEGNWEEVVYGSVSSAKSAAEKKSGSTFTSWIQDAYAAGEDLAAAGGQLADTFSTEFKNELYANGIIPEDYAQWLVDEQKKKIENVASKLGEDGPKILQEAMQDKRWTDTSLDALDSIDFNNIDPANLDELFNAITNFYNTEVVQDLRADLEALITTTSDLSIGDILSEEDYQLLLKYNEELEKYFIYTGKGYKYLGGADDEITNIGIDEYLNKMQQYKEASEYFDTSWRAEGKEVDWIGRSTDYSEGSSNYGSEQISNFIKSEKAMDFISGINENYTEDYLQGIIDNLNSDDEELKTEGERLAKEFWNAFNEAYTEGSEWTGSKANEIRYSQATNSGELEKIHKNFQDDDAYEKQLRTIAGSYEECEEALEDYNKEVEAAAGDAKKLQKAQDKLSKAIKKVEWDKFTDDALKYAKALKTATSDKDIQKNLKSIQKAFKKDMGFEVSTEALDKYKDKFIEWADAGEETSDDVATQLYSLLQLEESMAQGESAFANFNEDILLQVDVDDGEAYSKFASLEDFYASVKDIVEKNPPVVDAQGNADFSNMIAEMIEAGYTAADVAAALQSIAQTEVDFSAWGTELPNLIPSDMNSIVSFINAFRSWMGDIRGDIKAPITVEDLKKTFGGSLPAVTGSGGGRHSGGSNSGGGGSKPKHAEKKNDSDKERYHTLLNQLEDLNAEYDDISEAAERAFGKDKLKNLDAQIKKTDELIDKQEEYLDAIEANLPVDKAVMDAYYQDTIGGPAIEYDERGNIANYDAIQDAMFAKYNQMAETYDEDSTEWQVFEKKYEQLEKYIEQYEETYDLLRDQEQEYQDLLNQRIDLQLEKVQYTVELKLNVSEDQIKLIEYQLGKVEDDGFKSLEAIGLLTAKANELNNQIQINKQGLNEALGLTLSLQEIQQVIAGNMSVLNGKNFTEDQIDAVKEYRDNLLDLNEEFDDIRENIEDKMMESFDAWNEKLETGIDLLDHYSSILESYQNIVDIVGQDTMGLSEEFMANLSQGQVDNAIDKVEATKKAYESLEQARAAAEDKLNEARANGDAASQEMWEKTLEELTEHSQEAQENMLSAWEDALSSIADQFELTVERVVKNFNDAVYSLGGLEGLADDFSKQQERADIMLDDYQKIYELSKLSRDINNSIDDTDLIGSKQKLKKLLGEVNALQEDGVEMSQYDLEYLQKTYDLRLAELELEEAQRAKNTVRLSKDNEGNWSYVYTQNTDAVDAAQQKYEDALYAMQDLSSNYIDEMSEKLIETSQEMAEALAELRVEDFASIDEYYAEVDRVQKYYQEQMDFQEDELNKAIANNKELYDEDWTAYHNATGYKISDTEDFVTAFKDSMLGTLMNSNSDVANFNDLIAGSVDGLTQGLLQAADTYYRNLEEAMNAAGTSTETFGQDIGEQIDQVVAKSDEGATAVEDMADRMNAAINETMDAITTWQQSYGLAMEQIIQSNLDVIESFNEMLATLSGVGEGVTISYDIAKNSSTTAKPERFASGGYTGNWGSSGKLGILDEKELILNQNDTANMLSMLQLTHELLNMIDLQTQTAKLGFGDLVASTIKDSQKEVLEQKVEITAEFPNVTDHNEIEEALMNLTNIASQYANRK